MDALGNPLRMVKYSEAEKLIEPGWLLQYRGTSTIGQLIQRFTGSVHSHSAMVARNGGGRLDVMEVRELIGGRRQPLLGHVIANSGKIDVFKPDTEKFPEYKPAKAIAKMRALTSCRYGYRSVLRIALRKIPYVWRYYSVDNRDVTPATEDGIRPHCSFAVSLAVAAGGVDMVPWKPHYLVTPADLTHSLFARYWGSLVS
jgi:hypothetical protein